ncbi:MAG: TonB-dependent receptor [Bacteroidota bacterium]
MTEIRKAVIQLVALSPNLWGYPQMFPCLKWKFLLLTLGILIVCTSRATAQIAHRDSVSLASLKLKSLEELMEIDITIVSRRAQQWFESPAAAFVISGDEIRRLGARSLPEALRSAPNLHVAQVDARQWAISARGFNSTTANKLLVLIDGRSVYTPLYSGVFWDVQNVLLEDVDRIEVISGPGGTLWGANAVNGIINVITKNSHETARNPVFVEAGVGKKELLTGAIRYAGLLGETGAYRTYARHFRRASTRLEKGGDASDSWSGTQAGFRFDFGEVDDEVLIQGDIYSDNADQDVNDDVTMKGGNVLAEWRHSLSTGSELILRSYFDYSHRRIPATFGEDLGTLDLDLQYRTVFYEVHDIIVGAGFRHSSDRVVNSAGLAFLPPRLQTRLYTAFVQDVMLLSEGVNLTLGSKFGHNDFSGFDYQPQIRLGWRRSEIEFLWLSVSRAVRTPSRIDRDLFAPGNPPYFFLQGGPGFKSEKLVAYEGGYRWQALRALFFDFALFYNQYNDLRSFEPGPPPVLKNGLKGTAYGAELVINTEMAPWWRVRAGYMHLQKKISLKSWSRDVNNGTGEGNDSKHRLNIYSFIDLTDDWELDGSFRFVDRLPNANAAVTSYSALDIRLGWNPTSWISLSLLVQNILESGHSEFGAPSTRKEFGREIYGSARVSL